MSDDFKFSCRLPIIYSLQEDQLQTFGRPLANFYFQFTITCQFTMIAKKPLCSSCQLTFRKPKIEYRVFFSFCFKVSVVARKCLNFNPKQKKISFFVQNFQPVSNYDMHTKFSMQKKISNIQIWYVVVQYYIHTIC